MKKGCFAISSRQAGWISRLGCLANRVHKNRLMRIGPFQLDVSSNTQKCMHQQLIFHFHLWRIRPLEPITSGCLTCARSILSSRYLFHLFAFGRIKISYENGLLNLFYRFFGWKRWQVYVSCIGLYSLNYLEWIYVLRKHRFYLKA